MIFLVILINFILLCNLLERWESGLIHQFAKLAYPIRVPGVRIPLSPQKNKDPAASGIFIL